jgi:hypothetical protein
MRSLDYRRKSPPAPPTERTCIECGEAFTAPDVLDEIEVCEDCEKCHADALLRMANAPLERCAVAHTLRGVVGNSGVSE